MGAVLKWCGRGERGSPTWGETSLSEASSDYPGGQQNLPNAQPERQKAFYKELWNVPHLVSKTRPCLYAASRPAVSQWEHVLLLLPDMNFCDTVTLAPPESPNKTHLKIKC